MYNLHPVMHVNLFQIYFYYLMILFYIAFPKAQSGGQIDYCHFSAISKAVSRTQKACVPFIADFEDSLTTINICPLSPLMTV